MRRRQLGDVVFVDVPDEGKQFDKGDEAAVVELVKAAVDVYCPVSGTVVEGNDVLADEPALVNTDPEGDGWFFKLRTADPSELDGLMDEAAYGLRRSYDHQALPSGGVGGGVSAHRS